MKLGEEVITALSYFLRLHALQLLLEDKHNFETESQNLFADPEVYDFIVVGGGTAGCVIARRLSKHFNVLLLEAGGIPPFGVEVAGFADQIFSVNDINYFYSSVPQKKLNDRVLVKSAAKMLGGGSSHNSMIHNRGSGLVYDEWAEITNDRSWRFQKVLRLFKKSENYSGIFPSKYRGTKGLLKVKTLEYGFPFNKEFINAGKELGLDYSDANRNHKMKEGLSPMDQAIHNGRRQSAYVAFIQSVETTRQKLKVVKYANVAKILFKKKLNRWIATGVKYLRHGKVRTAKAKKEVIVSAGAFGEIFWRAWRIKALSYEKSSSNTKGFDDKIFEYGGEYFHINNLEEQLNVDLERDSNFQNVWNIAKEQYVKTQKSKIHKELIDDNDSLKTNCHIAVVLYTLPFLYKGINKQLRELVSKDSSTLSPNQIFSSKAKAGDKTYEKDFHYKGFFGYFLRGLEMLYNFETAGGQFPYRYEVSKEKPLYRAVGYEVLKADSHFMQIISGTTDIEVANNFAKINAKRIVRDKKIKKAREEVVQVSILVLHGRTAHKKNWAVNLENHEQTKNSEYVSYGSYDYTVPTKPFKKDTLETFDKSNGKGYEVKIKVEVAYYYFEAK